MARYKLIVFTDAVAGKEDEYNRWYNEVHLADVVAVPGFISAQRFKLDSAVIGGFSNRYLAIYDMETDDPAKVMEIVGQRSNTEQMVISEAINLTTNNVGIFSECSELVMAPAATTSL
jgi:hypothetical protein